MPSPFPGMNPFLERDDAWPDFHHRLIDRMADALADQVDPRVDTSSDEYTPGTTADGPSTATHDPDTVLDADDPRRTDGTDGTHRA